MKILHVVQGYTPAIGGTERLVQKVSENLVARHGDEVTVFTTTAYNCELFWRSDQPELPAGIETINGVTVRRFRVFNKFNEARRLLAGGSYKLRLPLNDRLRALYNGPIIPALTRAIAQSGADVVAASSFPLLHMHNALRGGRRAGVPVIFYGGIHTADDFGFNRPMIYQAIKKADAYVAYTTFERDYLVQERGIPAEKIAITGVGVDLEPFAAADGRAIRERFHWQADDPVVAFIGQQVPHKGLDMIMAAMEQIWQETPTACLLIAGAQTTYSQIVQQWRHRLPPVLQERVGIINNFPEAEKPALYAASDMVLYPSAHESFGIVFLEAWAARKPVIGARVGAVAAVIGEGQDGLLITHRSVPELIAAIRTLLANPELRQQMGTAGYQKVRQQYTWDIVADKFRAVYLHSLTTR
ncbi:MAG: glycosyltransferase family 4 protein [Anaerolinea sp.]|nr:glycosyltransferase family 4 protein [Anaerolinea sp.]